MLPEHGKKVRLRNNIHPDLRVKNHTVNAEQMDKEKLAEVDEAESSAEMNSLVAKIKIKPVKQINPVPASDQLLLQLKGQGSTEIPTCATSQDVGTRKEIPSLKTMLRPSPDASDAPKTPVFVAKSPGLLSGGAKPNALAGLLGAGVADTTKTAKQQTQNAFQLKIQ